ncbi:unnamed protein product [Prorocentrum cordatum]|uniref:Uncharacterized protein n=1 Tax=Prorocentrum cordatum TaxID=2364126 RepID=A0ABN9QYQ1_9DINO|nr:unnamed protein product [Polarella glacialis]
MADSLPTGMPAVREDQACESQHCGGSSASCGSWSGDMVAPAPSCRLDGGEPSPADNPGERAALDDAEAAAAASAAPPVEWYPCGSMELDAVAAQEVMMRAEAERASTCGSGASTPGLRSRGASRASTPGRGGSRAATPALCDVAMSLESFLEEEVPAFPFSKGATPQGANCQ